MAMTAEHKEALRRGRAEARAIKAYLAAVEARGPGRPVTRDSLEARLARVEAKIAAADDPLARLELIQTKLDIVDSLRDLDARADFEALEAGFVAHAGSYSERKQISYTAWREVGVPAATLKAAGIPETRRR